MLSVATDKPHTVLSYIIDILPLLPASRNQPHRRWATQTVVCLPVQICIPAGLHPLGLAGHLGIVRFSG